MKPSNARARRFKRINFKIRASRARNMYKHFISIMDIASFNENEMFSKHVGEYKTIPIIVELLGHNKEASLYSFRLSYDDVTFELSLSYSKEVLRCVKAIVHSHEFSLFDGRVKRNGRLRRDMKRKLDQLLSPFLKLFFTHKVRCRPLLDGGDDREKHLSGLEGDAQH